MIIINKINYVHDDMAIEIHMNGGFVIRLWADAGCEDSVKALNEFRTMLLKAITEQCAFITISDFLNVKTWAI